MKTRLSPALLGVFATVQAQTVIDPVIDSVAMFKNGLTVVHASFEAAAPGDYLWVDPPKAVHGAFFVEAGRGMVARSTTRAVMPRENPVPTGNLQIDLAGAEVRVSLRGAQGQAGEEVRGTVWTGPAPDRGSWNTNYASTNPSSFHRASLGGVSRVGVMERRDWLVIDAEERRYLAMDLISQVRVEKKAKERLRVKQPVLLFSTKKAGRVQLTYLSKGMAWAPTYRVEMLENDRLRLTQSAVLRNELMNLKNTRLELISGYPNIKFGHVDSLLNSQATLAVFFQQVSQRGGGQRGLVSQQVLYNNIAGNDVGAAQLLPQPNAGAGAGDLHYESIGAHDLREGDALSLEVASAETSCEQVVEWKVPDFRDSRGRYGRRAGNSEENKPWDVVQFSNPLKFPMTTGAASILENKRFRGQSASTWVGPGQKASIKINKALTVHAEHSEVEEKAKQAVVRIAGDNFQRTTVKGRLKVCNTRATAVEMVIQADFSGEFVEAEGNPAESLRPDEAGSVNALRQLEWTVALKAGETKILSYRYSLLVNR